MHQTPIGWAFWLGNVQASDCSGKPALSIRPLGEHVSLLVNRNPSTSSSYLLLFQSQVQSFYFAPYRHLLSTNNLVGCAMRGRLLHSGDGLAFQGRECVTVTRVRKWLFACKILRNLAITYSTLSVDPVARVRGADTMHLFEGTFVDCAA